MPTRTLIHSQSSTAKAGNQFLGTSVKEVTEQLHFCASHVPSQGSPYSRSTHQQLRGAQDVTQLTQWAGSPILIPRGWNVNTPRLQIRMIPASVVTHQIRLWIPHGCIYRHVHMRAQKGSTLLPQKTLRILFTGAWEGTWGSLVLFRSLSICSWPFLGPLVSHRGAFCCSHPHESHTLGTTKNQLFSYEHSVNCWGRDQEEEKAL